MPYRPSCPPVVSAPLACFAGMACAPPAVSTGRGSRHACTLLAISITAQITQMA
jgi:hypothetical protein